MPNLVTIAEVQHALRVTGSHEEEASLELLLRLAEAIVLGYVKQRLDVVGWPAEVDAWTYDTADGRVIAAILRQVIAMYRFRGDDPEGVGPAWDDGLAPGVKGLLVTLRDPMLA